MKLKNILKVFLSIMIIITNSFAIRGRVIKVNYDRRLSFRKSQMRIAIQNKNGIFIASAKGCVADKLWFIEKGDSISIADNQKIYDGSYEIFDFSSVRIYK